MVAILCCPVVLILKQGDRYQLDVASVCTNIVFQFKQIFQNLKLIKLFLNVYLP